MTSCCALGCRRNTRCGISLVLLSGFKQKITSNICVQCETSNRYLILYEAIPWPFTKNSWQAQTTQPNVLWSCSREFILHNRLDTHTHTHTHTTQSFTRRNSPVRSNLLLLTLICWYSAWGGDVLGSLLNPVFEEFTHIDKWRPIEHLGSIKILLSAILSADENQPAFQNLNMLDISMHVK